MEDQKIKEILIEKNRKFKDLFLKHQECEEKLLRLRSRKHKSDEEHITEKNIKKEKLILKDAMQKLIFEFRERLN